MNTWKERVLDMYSPKVKEEHVRALYQLKQIVKQPMTVLLAEALEEYLKNKQQLISKENENEDPRGL